MEKFLKPDRLDIDPSATNADQHYRHWKLTFDNFLDNFTTTGENNVAVPLSDQKKYAALINYVSHSVYSYISSTATYEDAIAKLEEMFIKPKNEIYVRHCLLSRQQQDGETIDQYMHALDVLSKECEFKDIAANAYRNEYVRDTFIRGVKSADIRQRLLENDTSDREATFNKARTLELAYKNNQLMQSNSSASIVNAIYTSADNEANQSIHNSNTTSIIAAINPSTKARGFGNCQIR